MDELRKELDRIRASHRFDDQGRSLDRHGNVMMDFGAYRYLVMGDAIVQMFDQQQRQIEELNDLLADVRQDVKRLERLAGVSD